MKKLLNKTEKRLTGRGMELRKQIGQLFILGFRGTELCEEDSIYNDIKNNGLGGVILFDRFLADDLPENNISSPSQLSQLCNSLKEAGDSRLFISIDQEGGKVCRLKQERGFFCSASAEEQGIHNLSYTYDQAEKCATALRNTGININFAPVADLNVNRENPIIGQLGRAFSHNPVKVTERCRIWLDSLQQKSIIGCLKHFPGHGSSHLDSHLGFVDISDTWSKEEIFPYTTLISENRVNAVMMGHLFHSGLDSRHPASLSNQIIDHLLRKELQFEGLVFTDDMQMKAITDKYGLIESAVLAIKAGVDQIIIGNNLDYDMDILNKMINGIVTSVQSGELPLQKIITANERITRIKEKWL